MSMASFLDASGADDVGAVPVAPESAPAEPEEDEGSDWLEDEYQSSSWNWDPDLWLYRERTTALLKRYMRLSVEVGRLPSFLGREFFRTRVTSYRSATFEDVAIFVHDVERSLEQLDDFEKKLIATVVLQDYTGDEAAPRLGCARRTVTRRLPEALDRLSQIFLKGGLLEPLAGGVSASA